MDIELAKIIEYSDDSLKSRALMRSIMLDFYPNNIKEINILLDVYESGIPQKIKHKGTISALDYNHYSSQLVYEYSLQEEYAKDGLDTWIKYILPDQDLLLLHNVKHNPNLNEVQNSSVNEHESTNSINNNNKIHISEQESEYVLKPLPDGTYEIFKFLGFDTVELVVPGEICGKKVSQVGKEAYKACKEINKLIISEGIVKIDDGAFTNCMSLSEVMLPDSLHEIGTGDDKSINGAFENTAIKEIRLPKNIIFIGQSTFMRCRKLKSIVLPDNIKKIEDFTFRACDSLESVSLSEGISIIGKKAFSGCVSLTSINFPKNLNIIEEEAFDRCKKLDIVALPSSTKRVNMKAFIECSGLRIFYCNEGLEYVGDYVFSHCPSLEKILFSKSIKSIGRNLFDSKFPEIYAFSGSVAIDWARTRGYKIKNAATDVI